VTEGKKTPATARRTPGRAAVSTKPKRPERAAAAAPSALDEAVQSVLHPETTQTLAAAAARPRRRATGAADAAPAVPVVDPTAAVAPPEPVPPATPPVEPAAATATAQAAGPNPFADASAGPLPDFDAIARNMQNLMEEGSKVAAELYKPREDRAPPVTPFRSDVSDAVRTLGQIAEHWFVEPARLMQAQAALTTGFFELWAKSASRMADGARGQASQKEAPPSSPPPGVTDKRFSDPEWRENPIYDFVHKAFLLGSGWANDLIDKTDGLDAPTKEKARFYTRQIFSALSPSNFVATNPELLRETLRENGGNLVRGMKMLAEDIAAGDGDLRIRLTDTSKFELGVNMALTPGKVVYRNDLMELLQYAPSTPDVLKRPLLIVPPWINKFYILDLNPEKSFIRWAVSQGLTVFVISWVNPDERHATKDFEAYMREGILDALDQVAEITGEADVSAIGYCVGGTLLAVTLAYMAAHGDNRITSATLFTAQVDFTHAGDLKVFADEEQISELEGQMKERGYLKGAQMAQAFNMLRPEDLIWSTAVSNYLKGKLPKPFDLLAWNSDAARMPAANHSFYLRNCYLENKLARGLMVIAGERLDLKRITIPIYNLATREDHIAPALSVFTGSQFFGGPVRYVLSGSGHVAGVVNPPARAKYGFTTGGEAKGPFQAWLDNAHEHPGSWWPDWIEWIKAQAPETVPAREPGGGRPTLGDAPGSYVRVKA
jgi:polyhydroxyalkanoate synthase